MSDEDGNETYYSLFLSHGGGCAHVIAEPLMWVWAWRWLSGGKACFMTKDRFKSMACFLGCIILRPLSAEEGRNARDGFPNGID